jgi:hypothetical protein
MTCGCEINQSAGRSVDQIVLSSWRMVDAVASAARGAPFEAQQLRNETRVFGSAGSDILLVDPYMDGTILTDFAGSAPSNVSLRLLTDSATVKPDLEPAAKRWKQQHATRHLELRLAPPRRLHDRVILVDRTKAWAITQSLKDLAKRSPAEIIRSDDTAALKVAAYEAEWVTATVLL